MVYIGFYSNKNNKRMVSPACISKIEYIIRSLNRNGYAVDVVSPAWSIDTCNRIYVGEKEKKGDNTFYLCATLSSNFIFFRYLAIIYSYIWLFLWIIFKVEKDENIIVYHSPLLAVPIILAKKIKKFKLILEVEEIYHEATPLKARKVKNEKKLFDIADKYIFSTELLSENYFKNSNKPYIISYGTYDIVTEKKNHAFRKSKINIVYAGIIDKYKKGAFNALKCTEYLDSTYELHILGFGDNESVNELIDKINSHNKKHECKVFFYGQKTGQEYIDFLSECDIGLSTQVAEGDYLSSSFPSKILVYLGAGLHVVSAKIECIKKSKISDLIHYYNGDYRDISDTIRKIDINNKRYNPQKRLEELSNEFTYNLNNIIKNK